MKDPTPQYSNRLKTLRAPHHKSQYGSQRKRDSLIQSRHAESTESLSRHAVSQISVERTAYADTNSIDQLQVNSVFMTGGAGISTATEIPRTNSMIDANAKTHHLNLNHYLTGTVEQKKAHTRGKNRFQAFPKRGIGNQVDLKPVFQSANRANQLVRDGSTDGSQPIALDRDLLHSNNFLDKV